MTAEREIIRGGEGIAKLLLVPVRNLKGLGLSGWEKWGAEVNPELLFWEWIPTTEFYNVPVQYGLPFQHCNTFSLESLYIWFDSGPVLQQNRECWAKLVLAIAGLIAELICEVPPPSIPAVRIFIYSSVQMFCNLELVRPIAEIACGALSSLEWKVGGGAKLL